MFSKENLTLTCIDGPSVNLSQPNKSINMPELAMIPTLDLFRGLSLGMRGLEGVWQWRVLRCWTSRDESQSGFYWQGQKLMRAPWGGRWKYPRKFKKCLWNCPKNGGAGKRNMPPDSNRYPPFVPSHRFHIIFIELLNIHMQMGASGRVAVICINLQQ